MQQWRHRIWLQLLAVFISAGTAGGTSVPSLVIWELISPRTQESDYPKTGNDITLSGAYADGSAPADRSFDSAFAQIASSGGTVLLPPGKYLINSLTVPRNVTLRFRRGAVLRLAPASTLNIDGLIEAGPYTIFEGEGRVRFGPGPSTDVLPDWWGIVYGDPSVDNSKSIQQAVNSVNPYGHLGKRISFGAGRICVRTTIRFASGILFSGAGASNAYGGTRIEPVNMAGDTVFVFDERRTTRWFHHGGFENIFISPQDSSDRPFAAISIAQMGENAILRNLVIYDCTFGIELGNGRLADIEKRFEHQVSANLQALSLHANTGAGIIIRKSTGLVVIDMLSGDDNGTILTADSCSTTLSIVVTGLKTEGPNTKGRSPSIELKNSYCSLTITGGWLVVPKGTINASVIEISGTQGMPRITISGVSTLNYTNAINDIVSNTTVSAYIRTGVHSVPRAGVYYNHVPEAFGTTHK
jgi:hypothetical protein